MNAQSFVPAIEKSVEPRDKHVLVHLDTKECVSKVCEKKPVDRDNECLELPAYKFLAGEHRVVRRRPEASINFRDLVANIVFSEKYKILGPFLYSVFNGHFMNVQASCFRVFISYLHIDSIFPFPDLITTTNQTFCLLKKLVISFRPWFKFDMRLCDSTNKVEGESITCCNRSTIGFLSWWSM